MLKHITRRIKMLSKEQERRYNNKNVAAGMWRMFYHINVYVQVRIVNYWENHG